MQLAFTVTRPGSPVQIAADEVTGASTQPFALEEELASRLLAALGVRPAPAAAKPEAIPAAAQVDYVLAAGHLERWDDAESIGKAIDLLTAIPGANDSALVQATLGRAYLRAYELSSDTARALLARQAAERAVALSPDLPEALVTLGALLTATGKPAEALTPIERALARQPDSADVEMALGRALHGAGRNAEAEAAFRRATELRPSSWVPWNALASFYFQTDRVGDAAKTYAAAAERNPGAPTVQDNLGAALFRQGDLTGAEAAFRRSLAIRPTSIAWSNLGTLLYAQSRTEDAVAAFREAVKLSPGDASLWMNLGDGLRRSTRPAEAKDAYERAIPLARAALAVNPKSAEAHAALALSLARTGHAPAAREEARAAVELAPKDPSVLLMSALVARLDGRGGDALALLDRGLAAGLGVHEIETEPDFDALRRDPRYQALLARERAGKKEEKVP
jgi:serine/threonine-protein kinase